MTRTAFTALLVFGALGASVPSLASAQRARRAPRVATTSPAGAANPYETPASSEAPAEQPSPPASPPPTPPSQAAPASSVVPPAAGTPSAPQTSSVVPPAPSDEQLRAEGAAIVTELVALRQRVSAVGRALEDTRVRITVEDRARDRDVVLLAIALDGVEVFRADASLRPAVAANAFEGTVAPGAHEVRLDVEHRGRDHEGASSSLRQSFRVRVVREHTHELRLIVDDGTNLSPAASGADQGGYDLRARLIVRALRSEGS